jgi:hypothetical protein
MDHRDKLERAVEHFEALKKEIDTYNQTWNRRFVSEVDSATGEHVARFKLNNPIPRSWSLIIGDAFHNVRSSLDAIAYELSVKHSGALSDQEARPIEFLIADTPEKFTKGKARKLGRMSPVAQSSIEMMQPYQPCGWGGGNPLAYIRDMDNIDKHRHLLLAFVNAGSGTISVGTRENPSYVPIRPGILRDGEEVARYPAPTGQAPGSLGHSMSFGFSLAETPLLISQDLANVAMYLPLYVKTAVFEPLERLL